jgi:hypothetical protein
MKIKRVIGFVRGAAVLLTIVAIGFGVVFISRVVVDAVDSVEQWGKAKYTEVLESLTIVKTETVIVPSDKRTVEESIELVSKRTGYSKAILSAMVAVESSGGVYLYRFEPAVFNKMKREGAKVSDSELRMLASSHGVTHVMGYNASKRCGLHWSELYNADKALGCTVKILKDNAKKYENTSKNRRVWLALRDYNGSGEMAEAYANKVLAEVGKHVLQSVVVD